MEILSSRNNRGVSEDKKSLMTIVVPTLNEEMGIRRLIEELKQQGYSNILVVDGNSSDNTVEIAKRSGVQVILQDGSGKGRALKTAIKYVDTPYILIMDGDCTYDPADVEKFLYEMENSDEIIGIRLNKRDNMTWFHRFGNSLITRVFNIVMGTRLSDVCSGMYLLKTHVAKNIELNSRGFEVEVEIAARIAELGKISEVPIRYRKRLGENKLSSWKHGLRILSSLLNFLYIYNPILFYSILAGFTIIPGTTILGWVFFEWLFNSTWHSGWALLGVVLVLFASNAMALTTISIVLKRIERKMNKFLRNLGTS